MTADGTAGPSGADGFKAEQGRYHFYVSLACPWAHRTMIFRALKQLGNSITVSVVNSFMGDEGWTFKPGVGVIPDTVNNTEHVYEFYTQALNDYTGRVTVPILWDSSGKP